MLDRALTSARFPSVRLTQQNLKPVPMSRSLMLARQRSNPWLKLWPIRATLTRRPPTG